MDLNNKNDSYHYNPTSVVKTLNRLGRKQTLNLVKKVCHKPVLCSKLSPVPPEMAGSSIQETVKDMLTKSSGPLLASVQTGSRPHTSQNPDFPMRQVDHVNQDVFFHVATHAPSVATTGLPQKKGLSPVPVLRKIKHVNSVSCVDPCLFVQNAQGVPTVVHDGPVGGRLQKFWQVWQRLGANPRAVSILKEGYSLQFKLRPPLTRVPIIQSSYANPVKSRFLKEALISLQGKLVVEPVLVRSSLAFYNRLFLVPKPENKWQPILDLSRLNKFLKTGTFKMETPETIRTSLQKGEWVTSLDFSDAYFHIPIHPRSRKYMRFFLNKRAYQFTALPFGLATAPLEFTKIVKEVKLMAQNRGIRIHQYLDDWLLRAPSREIGLLHTQVLLSLCHELGWLVNLKKSELNPQQVFTFVGYRFDLLTGRVLPTQERWASLRQKLLFLKSRDSCTVRQFMSLIGLLTATEKQVRSGRLHMRPIQWHLKRHWQVPEVLEKVIPLPPSLQPHLDWWLDEENVLRGQPLHPLSHALQLFTDASNEGWDAHLGDSTARGVWSEVESQLHINFLELKAVFLAEFRASLSEPDCLGGDRQHNCGRLYQQTRGYEIRLSLCPPLETPFLVPPQRNSSESQAHSGSVECHSRQAVPAQSGDPDRVVPVPTGVQSLVFQLGPAADRSFCHQIQSQASQVCLSCSGLDSLGGGCSQPSMGQPECVRLSPSLPAQSGRIQTGESRISQNDLNRSGLAQHVLVLGPDQSIKSNSLQSSLREEPVDSTVQRPSPQELESSESACLAPRALSIRRQGFSEEVAARIEAPQRSSTRAVYKSKWAIFVKWCESSQVDFRAPSLKQVADFLLYLFKERQLQPSTIEGYRTAIADMLGNDPVHFGKDESLTRLLDSFHRDKPKGRRGVPAWNLSLVLHQLTKAPFEPMRKASLKHLTFKTVFLLALGSGKRRSEIHAWLYRNIRHQENWSQVSLYPSPSFLSKNQLARDGPAAVAPVVIPALAPSLDRSLKEDKSLCPVRALRYYLDRTKDLRSGKDLVFVSFRKSFQKDIVPATVSSWIKQTVLLCYQLSDQEAQTIHQVRAHDVRAFAASKAFQDGVSLDQILSACHWKAHNTFTQFYLKDLAWADSELYHLGPVVAAQQIHEHQ